MAESATAPAEAKKEDAKKEESPPTPAHLREEMLLKFAGTATAIFGIILLISSSVAMAVLSVLKFNLGPWLPVLPLSLLIVVVGLAVNVYFRKVIDRAMNPKKYEEPPRPPPMGFPYPYAMPPPFYPMRMPSPPVAAQRPVGPGPSAPTAGPTTNARFCIMCGKRIPMEAKFCPYCRHASTA